MNNLGTLYKVEIKKILSKKAVWIMFSIGMTFLLLTALSELFFNNHSFPDGSHMSASEYQAIQREKANEISKGPIDDKMLGEMRSTLHSFLAKHEKDMKKMLRLIRMVILESGLLQKKRVMRICLTI